MRLWTIQPVDVWRQVEEQGVALVDPGRMVYAPPAYEWLTGRGAPGTPCRPRRSRLAMRKKPMV